MENNRTKIFITILLIFFEYTKDGSKGVNVDLNRYRKPRKQFLLEFNQLVAK